MASDPLYVSAAFDKMVETDAPIAGSLQQAASNKRPYRLAVVASHPVQYQAPLFRRLASHPEIDLMVYYCSDHGVAARLDVGFGLAYTWDIPLLEGYRYRFLPNRARRHSLSFGGLFNPGIVPELLRERYDAVLVIGWYAVTSFLTFVGAWLSRTPILMYGDSASIQRRPWWIRLPKYLVLHMLFRTFSGFLISGTFNHEFYAQYGVPVSKMFAFPWAIDNEAFFESAREARLHKQEIQAHWGISSTLPIIVFSGKLIPRKRPLDLLRAFEPLSHRASLVYIGEGELRGELERYVAEHSIRNVRFLGFVNQRAIAQVMAVCDVFCLPSAHDPRGTVVNEAMACSLPVVVSEGVGVWGEGDIVRHGVNGFVHPMGDVDALTQYLQMLIADADLRQRMSIHSSAIIEKWSYTECIQGLLDALQAVARHWGEAGE